MALCFVNGFLYSFGKDLQNVEAMYSSHHKQNLLSSIDISEKARKMLKMTQPLAICTFHIAKKHLKVFCDYM